jgi:hypothetical protein
MRTLAPGAPAAVAPQPRVRRDGVCALRRGGVGSGPCVHRQRLVAVGSVAEASMATAGWQGAHVEGTPILG